MKNLIFHTVQIADRTFEGRMTDFGPYLVCRESKTDIAIEPAVLCKHSNDRGEAFGSGTKPNQDPAGWWVAKYDTQLTIDLRHFTDDQAALLAAEFGLPTFPLSRTNKFFESPAWAALVTWTEQHPRLAKTYAQSIAYGMDWYARAQALIEKKKAQASCEA